MMTDIGDHHLTGFSEVLGHGNHHRDHHQQQDHAEQNLQQGESGTGIRVRYRRDDVTRSVNGGTSETVLEGIPSLRYTFYDSNGTATTTEADIKMVAISMSFEQSVVDVDVEDTVESARVVLRNRAVN